MARLNAHENKKKKKDFNHLYYFYGALATSLLFCLMAVSVNKLGDRFEGTKKPNKDKLISLLKMLDKSVGMKSEESGQN